MKLVYSMKSSQREHATKHDDSGHTMCGRLCTNVVINNGMPTCRTCLRAINAILVKSDGARIVRVVKVA
jgi:hypothetical protein